MKKSIIAIVAAVGVAFAATSAVADSTDTDWTDAAFPAKMGKANIQKWKPASACDTKDWAKCVWEKGTLGK